MKIYFSASIRAGRENAEVYSKIIDHLKKHGQVLTEHIGDKNLTEDGEIGLAEEYIYERDIKWLKECDVFIAEVTTPSLGVGYEIAKAEEFGKKVLCLYKQQKGKKLSGMILGNRKIKVIVYKNLKEAVEKIDDFLIGLS